MKVEIPDSAFLAGEKIYLRSYEDGDEQVIARIENHPDSRETLFYAKPTSLEYQKQKSLSQQKNSNEIVFTICEIVNGKAIGQAAFFRIDWVGRMATFYIGIGAKEDRSKGYGSEVLNLMLSYAFDTLNLNRVQLHVAVENTAAIKIYKRMGFVLEGTIREAMFHKGRYCDFYLMGILKREWENS